MNDDTNGALAHVYTVAGAKGGVGKTTTSINVGASLAATGLRTVVVELDLAMANLVDFIETNIDVEEAPTLHDVLAGEASVDAATYETDSGLWVVPSGTTLSGYAETDLKRLPDTVKSLSESFDVVLLDTPAGLSEETMRPMQVSDDLLLVSTPRVASVRNAKNTKELSQRVGTPVRGLVLTKSGTGASPGADRIAAFLDVDLLGHVPEDDAVPHSQDKGQPVVVNAPNSGAAVAYQRIAEKLADAPVFLPNESPASSTDPDAASGQSLTDGAATSEDNHEEAASGEVPEFDTETVLGEASQSGASSIATDGAAGDQSAESADESARDDQVASTPDASDTAGESVQAARSRDEPGQSEQARTESSRADETQDRADAATPARSESSPGDGARNEPAAQKSRSDGGQRQESSEQESESLSNRVLSLLRF